MITEIRKQAGIFRRTKSVKSKEIQTVSLFGDCRAPKCEMKFESGSGTLQKEGRAEFTAAVYEK